jgi:hypothetical protein
MQMIALISLDTSMIYRSKDLRVRGQINIGNRET